MNYLEYTPEWGEALVVVVILLLIYWAWKSYDGIDNQTGI